MLYTYSEGLYALWRYAMNRILTLCLLPLLLAFGCSLNHDDSGTAAVPSLKLLVNGTNKTMVSDFSANDWSPQMQTHYGIPYIYFLSDRNFSTNDYMGYPINTGPGTNGIFRAQMVEPGIYSNLECLFAFPAGYRVKSIVVPPLENLIYASVSPEEGIPFQLYRVENAEGWIGSWSTVMTSPYNIDLAGYADIYGTSYLYVSHVTNVGLYFGIRVLEPMAVPVNYWDPLSRTYRMIPFNFIMKKRLSLPGEIGDHWPVTFSSERQAGKSAFGFICSWGGVLCLGVDVYLSNAEDSYNQNQTALEVLQNTNNVMETKRALPVFWITHYPGTIDRTPSFDPATGLYFASTREGMGLFNLYRVPLPYLTIPDTVVIPEDQLPAPR